MERTGKGEGERGEWRGRGRKGERDTDRGGRKEGGGRRIEEGEKKGEGGGRGGGEGRKGGGGGMSRGRVGEREWRAAWLYNMDVSPLCPQGRKTCRQEPKGIVPATRGTDRLGFRV